jgi:hypothetical protein
MPATPRHDLATERLRRFVSDAHGREQPHSNGAAKVAHARLLHSGRKDRDGSETVSVASSSHRGSASRGFANVPPWEETVTLLQLHEHSVRLDAAPDDAEAAIAALDAVASSLADEVARNVVQKAKRALVAAIAVPSWSDLGTRIDDVLAKAEGSGAQLAPTTYRGCCDALLNACEKLLDQVDKLALVEQRQNALNALSASRGSPSHDNNPIMMSSSMGPDRALDRRKSTMAPSPPSSGSRNADVPLAQLPAYQAVVTENTELHTSLRQVKIDLREAKVEVEYYKAHLLDLRRVAKLVDHDLPHVHDSDGPAFPQNMSVLALLKANTSDFDAIFTAHPDIAEQRLRRHSVLPRSPLTTPLNKFRRPSSVSSMSSVTTAPVAARPL